MNVLINNVLICQLEIKIHVLILDLIFEKKNFNFLEVHKKKPQEQSRDFFTIMC